MFTVEQVKAMDVNQIIHLIEEKTKCELSPSLKIHLAMLHGVGEAGVEVFSELGQCIDYAVEFKEFLNYEDLTLLLNKGEV